MTLKNNLKFAIIFTAAILLFQWRIILMRSLFIGGDNLVQFYPWFKVYSESIRHFMLPFWTRYMQSGFPLMAEGQVGGFYLFNMLFFSGLPFNIAYSYSVVFHFIVGGVSIYFLSRKLGACELGGAVAALVFCFGSAYAGCFYNIISLRTLCWTPLVFLLFELFFEKQRPYYIMIAGVVYGMQLLAGFVQFAVYCWIFYLVYFICRHRSRRDLLCYLTFSAISFFIFLPQLILTYNLIMSSSRATADLQFALWGSYNPALLVQTVFPYWARFARNDFYFSIFGILFLLVSFSLLKDDKKIRAVFIIFVLSFLLALGKYNPVYVLLVKLGHLYSFRNPSKFLFFTSMAASILIGKGFSVFFKDNFHERGRALRSYNIILCVCGLVFLASKAVITLFKDAIIKLGEQYASKFIFGTSAHRYGIDIYMKKVGSVYQAAISGVSFNSIFNIASWLLLILALIVSLVIIKRRNARIPAYSKYLVICVIIADLFIYSFIGRGFNSNLRNYSALNPTNAAIYNYIKSDKDVFRVLPYGIGSGKLPFWIMPNTNILYGIDSVAGYTPLANEGYRKALLPLEVIDNSLGVRLPEENSINECMGLLRLLNVKYVISCDRLGAAGLEFILEDGGIYLYKISNYLPRAFVVKDFDVDSIDSNIDVKMVKYDSGSAVFKIDMPYKGFLIFSENNYTGWKAYVNGGIRELKRVSLVSAVELDKGENRVSFIYRPY